jgi:hypothetical protein
MLPVLQTPYPIAQKCRPQYPLESSGYSSCNLRGRSTFRAFNKITNVQRWPVFDVDMHVVFAHNPFKYLDILRITNLLHKLTASLFDVALQNFISIFCNPNYVGSKPRYCMATNSLFFTHKVKLAICVATESLALKALSFN